MISIEDFMNMELKVAAIEEVQEHPDADRLYVLKVVLGQGEVRQLVAGIRPSYAKEDLIGKQVVIVANLQPASIRGIESQGMILAASDENGIVVLSPEKPVALGSRVK